MRVQRNQILNGENFALLVESKHGSIRALTAVHRQDFRRRFGGARFVRRGGASELGHLSKGMTEKCLAAGLPADGQKTILVCPEGIPDTYEERARILSEHIGAVASQDPGVIFGPDMNNPEAVMDRVSDDSALRDHVSGLNISHGGFSIDHFGYTATGVVEAARQAIADSAVDFRTAIVQGFGAVGAKGAQLLSQDGIRVCGVSTIRGTLREDQGLDVDWLHRRWLEQPDFDPLEYLSSGRSAIFDADPDSLLSIPADIFLPAARTSVLARSAELELVRSENPQVRSVEEFHRRTGVKLVLEGANHPLSDAAEIYLQKQGVVVLPDFIVNCAGLVGCFFEWVFREDLLQSRDLLAPIQDATLRYATRVIQRNVRLLLSSDQEVRKTCQEIVKASRERLLPQRDMDFRRLLDLGMERDLNHEGQKVHEA